MQYFVTLKLNADKRLALRRNSVLELAVLALATVVVVEPRLSPKRLMFLAGKLAWIAALAIHPLVAAGAEPESSVSGVDAVHEQPLAGRDAAKTMRVPEGFRVTLFAGEPDVMQPIGFCIDDRGRLWVAEAYNYPNHGDTPGDRIVILEDSDGDGHFDNRTVFYDGLNYVTGIEVGFGGAWVMSPPNMYFIPDADGDDIPDSEPTVLLDGFGNHANAHNLANGFAWGPDGWLYGTHGRTNWSMIGKPGTAADRRTRFDGGVYRYHPLRHVWEPFADGTTNPWGIDWNDEGDAFVCNCVNPHLFQVIQGAHYEPWRGRQSSQYAYQRIGTIADHLHFVGLANVRNGLGSDLEDQAGGGHAHCGTMIYLGDQFPPAYRNQLFTNNIHGRRINNDLLRVSGSGYVASHGADLMRSQDPWFMGVTLAYGPRGEVYVSDWSDTGECHSTRNTRKHTGRIYRLTYLQTDLAKIDMQAKSAAELVAYQTHDNDWLVRHARRLLQERFSRGDDMSEVHLALTELFDQQSEVAKKLRALWALKVTAGLSAADLEAMLDHRHEAIRKWAVTILCESGVPRGATVARLVKMAAEDPSPRVRLSLASCLQRLEPQHRWSLGEALAARSEDARDANLPLMYWYGIEPLIADDLSRYANLALQAGIPRLRTNVARRIASSTMAQEGIELLAQNLARETDSRRASDVLGGILLGLEGRRQVPMPEGWRLAYQRLQRDENASVREQSTRLALVFRDPLAILALQASASDRSLTAAVRRRAIDSLVSSRQPGFDVRLLDLVIDSDVQEVSIRGLAQYHHDGTAATLLSLYPSLDATTKQTTLATLASRRPWAARLLDSVEAGQIPPSDITALTARQLRSLGDDAITQRLQQLWGEIRETKQDLAKQISAIRKWLTDDVIADADLKSGKGLFVKHCANCHQFFGEGGKVGPDITGAQRNNLDYMLENIVDPSASVSNDFRMHLIATTDGRVITGLVESDNDQSLTVLTANDRIVIPRDEIETRTLSKVSIMPVGLLENMTEQEIRDLLGYLRS